jgi:hypothetical protein
MGSKMRSADKVSVRSPKPRRLGSIPRVRAIGVKAQVDVLAVDAARPGFESQILHKILTMKKKFDAH